METKPLFFVVAGSNGAGKSTLSKLLLPESMKDAPVWDGDMRYIEVKEDALKMGLEIKEANELAREKVVAEFSNEYKGALQEKRDFAYEGHFSGGGQWQPLVDAKTSGHHVHMLYIGLPTANESVKRVADRVRRGGHHVNEQTIKSNFYGNLDMVDLNHSIPNTLGIYESSRGATIKKICELENGRIISAVAQIPDWMKKELPQINDQINKFKAESAFKNVEEQEVGPAKKKAIKI